jgi:hypothetical protein
MRHLKLGIFTGKDLRAQTTPFYECRPVLFAYDGLHNWTILLALNGNNADCFGGGRLEMESNLVAAVGAGEKEMGRGGFEPPTHGFSVRCSTN